MPLSIRYISKYIFSGQVAITNFLLEQAEENRCNFGAADVRVRTDSAIGVTDYIGVVVIAVQHIRHIGCCPTGIDRLVARHFHIGDLVGQRFVGVPAGEGVAFTGGSLVQRNGRAGGIAFVLIRSAAVGLIMQCVLRGAAASAAGRTAAGGGCFLIQQCKRRETVCREFNELLTIDRNLFTGQVFRDASCQQIVDISVTVAVDALKVDDMELRV